MPLSSFRSSIVERTITALNQGSLDEFMAQFASDAEVVDVSTYKGHQAISAWVKPRKLQRAFTPAGGAGNES